MSYSQAPDKSVVNDFMDKLSSIIVTKRMLFAFLVEDHPVCASLSHSSRLGTQACAVPWSLPYTVCDDERYLQAVQRE